MKISIYKINKVLILIILIISIQACTTSKDKENEKNSEIMTDNRIEPNVEKRTREIRDKGGGIFNSSRSSNNNFDFSTSNVLWRASLESLESIPLNNVDYSGGVIVTDWYSLPKSNESIKITVRFLSNKLAVSSVKIISHKKICEANGRDCLITLASNKFNEDIKNKIISKAKELKLLDEKNK